MAIMGRRLSHQESFDPNTRLVCVGFVRRAHGIRGDLLIHSLTEDPLTIGTYDTLMDGEGGSWTPHQPRPKGHDVILRFEGVETRDQAERLKGKQLFVHRQDLPHLNDGEWYWVDMVGFNVMSSLSPHEPKHFGIVGGMSDYGAGPVLSIHDKGREIAMIPFIDDAVNSIDMQGQSIFVVDAYVLWHKKDDKHG